MDYSVYLNLFDGKNELSYGEQLSSMEWKIKREYILQRDNFKCVSCGLKDYLEVHHKYYIWGRNVWEYDNEVLVTLCSKCHKNIHLFDTIEWKMCEDGYYKDIELIKCQRCSGKGYFDEYRHVENGICFRCRGLKYDNLVEELSKYNNKISFLSFENFLKDTNIFTLKEVLNGFKNNNPTNAKIVYSNIFSYTNRDNEHKLMFKIYYSDNRDLYYPVSVQCDNVKERDTPDFDAKIWVKGEDGKKYLVYLGIIN